MLENVYEGLNARPKVYLSKEYFCEMYPTCVSSKLCEFILVENRKFMVRCKLSFLTETKSDYEIAQLFNLKLLIKA